MGKTDMKYEAIYKCRLCGKFIVGDRAVEENKAIHIMNRLLSEENTKLGNQPYWGHRYDNHVCEDGSFGFGDFQGFRKRGKENE